MRPRAISCVATLAPKVKSVRDGQLFSRSQAVLQVRFASVDHRIPLPSGRTRAIPGMAGQVVLPRTLFSCGTMKERPLRLMATRQALVEPLAPSASGHARMINRRAAATRR